MKKEELIALGLDETTAIKVEKASNEELKGFIPKNRFDEVNDTKKTLESQLSERDAQLTELNKKVKGNEELEKTIAELQTTNAATKTEYEAKLKDIQISSAIQSKLNDTKYADLLEGKFDKTKLSISQDGTVIGIDEQLKSIKETYKDLFTPVVAGREPQNTGGSSASITKDKFNAMSYKERVELCNSDPELYKQLSI